MCLLYVLIVALISLGMFYGNLREPVDWGSRTHGSYLTDEYYAEGGGVIRLICSDTATVDGLYSLCLLPYKYI